MDNKSGIYAIEHVESGKQYIGSARKFVSRFSLHKMQLRSGEHHSAYLQRAWDKYGEAAFIFKVLIQCTSADLLRYEQLAIDALRPSYNMNPKAGSVTGLKWTAAQKLKHKTAMKNRKLTTEGKTSHKQQVKQAWANGAYAKAMRSKSNIYRLDGAEYTIAEAAKKFNINANTLKYRLAKGMTFADAIMKPLIVGGRREQWLYNGMLHTMAEIAELCGIKRATINKRMYMGMTFEEAVSTPLRK